MSDKEDESTIYLEIKALFGIDDDEGLRWAQFSGSRKGASFPKCRWTKRGWIKRPHRKFFQRQLSFSRSVIERA